MRTTLDFEAVLSQWPLLLTGLAWTLGLTLLAAPLGVVIGAGFAWCRSQGPRWAARPVAAYVEMVRNTPFIVQLFFIYFGLPAAGVKLSAPTASALAMVINLGAYATEIVRAGIAATPRGQWDAAASLGLNRWQSFLLVVLPRALQRVWPALTSQIVIVMLGSSVCGQISTEELSYAANLIQSRNFRAFESFIVATLLHLGLAVALRQGLNWLGPRFLFGRSRHV